jgi:hypothetical protein
MAGRQMRWREAKRRDRHAPLKGIPIPADAAFWRAWRDNPKAMRTDGYGVEKTKDGWRAFITRS